MDYLLSLFQLNYQGLENEFFKNLLISIVIVFVISFVVQIFYYLFFYIRIYKPDKLVEHKNKPSISVIIAARNEADNLNKFLPRILNQNYSDFEVIVVNDASEDESVEVLERFKRENSNFYFTSIPYDTNFTHGKKLAILLGYKAAKKDWMVFIDADCYPESTEWLNEMAKGMDDEAELILGYGAHLSQRSFINKIVRYDTVSIAMQYLSFAQAGVPYMGVGRNLAVRKSSFDKLKKYKTHSHLLSGSDDLLVNELATKKNTRTISSSESFTYSIPQISYHKWVLQKIRHISTSKYYKGYHKLLLALEPLSKIFFYFSLVILLLTKIAFNVAILLFLLRFIIQTIVWIKAKNKFKAKDLLMVWFLFDTFVYIIIGFISTVSLFRQQKIRWK